MKNDTLNSLIHNRAAQRIALIVFGLLILFFLIQTYGKAYREIGNDFTGLLAAADAVRQGENPYETGSPFPYTRYPLFLAFALIPLVVLPYWLATALWFILNVFAIIYTVRIIADTVGEGGGTRWGPQLYVPSIILGLLFTPIIQNNLLNGQVNFPVLLLCALFFQFHLKKKSILAAVFLSLAISIKLVPGVLLFYLLFRRDYRVLAGTVVLTLILSLAPIITLGDRMVELYTWYVNSTITGLADPAAALAPGSMFHTSMFFSLHGLITYLFPAAVEINWLKPLSMVVVLLGTIGCDLVILRRRGRSADVWVFALYLLATLLILPISETHHLVMMVPALYILMLSTVSVPQIPIFRATLYIGLPCLLLYLGKAAKSGPFFFIMLVLLFGVIINWCIFQNRSEHLVGQS